MGRGGRRACAYWRLLGCEGGGVCFGSGFLDVVLSGRWLLEAWCVDRGFQMHFFLDRGFQRHYFMDRGFPTHAVWIVASRRILFDRGFQMHFS